MLRVFQKDASVLRLELGLTRDKYSRAELRSLLRIRINSLAWNPVGSQSITLPLQQLVDEFAEKVATGAVLSVQKYFAMRGTSGFTVGGRRAVNVPLRYTRTQLRPSPDDVGALGEGIAGFYLEDVERLQLETRPFDVSPDFILRDSTSNSVVLCEVKTALEAWPRTLVRDAMDLLEILSKIQFIRNRKYVAYVAHVMIQGPNDFELRRLRIEVV